MRSRALWGFILFLASFEIMLFCACASQSSSQNCQTVYNHITAEGSNLDFMIHKLYNNQYTVIDIRNESEFKAAKVSEGSMPRDAVSKDGQELEGYVLIVYVITDAGKVIKPVVIKRTDKDLDEIALKAMEGWRFVPATLNGKPVWSTAAQEFIFKKKTI